MPSFLKTCRAHSPIVRYVDPWTCIRCLTTSNGFMKASLAIVAHAPLLAGMESVSFQIITISCSHLLQADGVQKHSHPWLASRPRMSQNRLRAPVLQVVLGCRVRENHIDHTSALPAPTTTLDRPLHSDIYPSTLEIVAIALPMPVYIAAGVGLTTCIRVYDAVSASSSV